MDWFRLLVFPYQKGCEWIEKERKVDEIQAPGCAQHRLPIAVSLLPAGIWAQSRALSGAGRPALSDPV